MEQELHEELEKLGNKIDVAVELVKRHEKELYGNGREGLVSVVDKMRWRIDLVVWLVSIGLTGIVAAGGEWLWRFLIH